MKITNIHARQILNANGGSAIDCDIHLSDGSVVNSSVSCQPNFDQLELIKDNSVEKSINIINEVIAGEFIGKEPHSIEMDIAMAQMDGTTDKSKFGVHTILVVSKAMFKAHALNQEMELFDFISLVSGLDTLSFPIPIINFIGSSKNKHTDFAIKDYLVIPYGTKGIRSAIESSALLFTILNKMLQMRGKEVSSNVDGAISFDYLSAQEPLDLLTEAMHAMSAGSDTFGIGIDIDASSLFNEKTNSYSIGDSIKKSDELIALYENLHKKYNLFAIHDGLAKNDWQGWIKLMNKLNDNMHIAANKLFSTNAELIAKGIELGAANTVVIDPSQIGTITETLQAIALCKENGLSTIVSNCSAETNDNFIVDLTVGSNCNYIKCGGLTRGEHTSKYNRLLEIEKILTDSIG